MARPTRELVLALRDTASRLRTEVRYAWGHMGVCNCGHLAQTITRLAPGDIHSSALEREGDWEQQAYDYCPTSGLRIDDITTELLELGLHLADIGNLEKLRDRAVLARLPAERRHLVRNRREDVILYMETWADLLDSELASRDDLVAA